MTVQRLEHIGVVVDDLEGAKAFFIALGLEVEGEATVEGHAQTPRASGCDPGSGVRGIDARASGSGFAAGADLYYGQGARAWTRITITWLKPIPSIWSA